jgi:hypothetical protein
MMCSEDGLFSPGRMGRRPPQQNLFLMIMSKIKVLVTEKRRMIRWQTDVASDAKPREIKRTQLTATECMDRRFRTGLCGCSHPPYTPLMLQLSPCLVVVILYMSLQSILVETKWWSCSRGEGPIDCGGWACTGVTMQSVNLNFKYKRRSKPSLSGTIWTPLHLWGYCATCGHCLVCTNFSLVL